MSELSTGVSNLGTGLIEVSALTTLIGSSTAMALALGQKGPAGLPWAAMSMFGLFSIIRACLAAATPAWLRETFGVRNAATDSAVGFSLDIRSSREQRARNGLGNAKGILCEHISVLLPLS